MRGNGRSTGSSAAAHASVDFTRTPVPATAFQPPRNGSLEREFAIHNAAASTHTQQPLFVHQLPSVRRMLVQLSRHCDPDTIAEPRPPLLLVGQAGVGKAATLCHWAAHRMMSNSRAAGRSASIARNVATTGGKTGGGMSTPGVREENSVLSTLLSPVGAATGLEGKGSSDDARAVVSPSLPSFDGQPESGKPFWATPGTLGSTATSAAAVSSGSQQSSSGTAVDARTGSPPSPGSGSSDFEPDAGRAGGGRHRRAGQEKPPSWLSGGSFPSLLPPSVWLSIASAQLGLSRAAKGGGSEAGTAQGEAGSNGGGSSSSMQWRGLDAMEVSDPGVLVPGGGAKECVVLHVAGASRESRSVLGLLRHVVSAASTFFELGFEPAWDERRLASQFARVLERASARGKLVLCVVGVNRLRSEVFTGLKWLPLHLPPNVRVVASATSSREDAQILQDLGRLGAEAGAALQLGQARPNDSFAATQRSGTRLIRRMSSTGQGGADSGTVGSTMGAEGGLLRYPSDECLAEIARREWPLVGCGPWSMQEARLVAVTSVLGLAGMRAVEGAAKQAIAVFTRPAGQRRSPGRTGSTGFAAIESTSGHSGSGVESSRRNMDSKARGSQRANRGVAEQPGRRGSAVSVSSSGSGRRGSGSSPSRARRSSTSVLQLKGPTQALMGGALADAERQAKAAAESRVPGAESGQPGDRQLRSRTDSDGGSAQGPREQRDSAEESEGEGGYSSDSGYEDDGFEGSQDRTVVASGEDSTSRDSRRPPPPRKPAAPPSREGPRGSPSPPQQQSGQRSSGRQLDIDRIASQAAEAKLGRLLRAMGAVDSLRRADSSRMLPVSSLASPSAGSGSSTGLPSPSGSKGVKFRRGDGGASAAASTFAQDGALESASWAGISITALEKVSSHPFATVARFQRLLWQGAWAAGALGLEPEGCIRSWLEAQGARDLLERVLATLSLGEHVNIRSGEESDLASRQLESYGFSQLGLGPMLPAALCLLYGARAGLSDSELAAGLTALFPRLIRDDSSALQEYQAEDPRGKRAKMLDGKRASSRQQPSDHGDRAAESSGPQLRRSFFAGGAGRQQAPPLPRWTLSEIMVRLRAVLQSVFAVPATAVRLVLPPSNAALRSIVWRRLLSYGRGLSLLRSSLCELLRASPSLLRRSREVSWLLRQGRRWEALARVVGDTGEAEHMWAESDTRRDLVESWLCLARAHSLPQGWSDQDDGDAAPSDFSTGGFRNGVVYGERALSSRGGLPSRPGTGLPMRGSASVGLLAVGRGAGSNLDVGAQVAGAAGMGPSLVGPGPSATAEDEAYRAKRAYMRPAVEGSASGAMNVEWEGFFPRAAPILRHLPWLRWVARTVSGAATEVGLASLPVTTSNDEFKRGLLPVPALPGCVEAASMTIAADLSGVPGPPLPHETASLFAAADPFESQLPPVLAAASGLRLCYGIVGASLSATGLSTAPPTHLVSSVGAIAGEALAWTQDSAIDAAVRAGSAVASGDPRRGAPTELDLARELQASMAYPADPDLDKEAAPPSAGLPPDWANPRQAVLPLGATAADAVACTGLLLGAEVARFAGSLSVTSDSRGDPAGAQGEVTAGGDVTSVAAVLAVYERKARVRGDLRSSSHQEGAKTRRRRGYTTAWLPTGAGDGFARVDAVRVYDHSLQRWMAERKPSFVRACQRIETIAEVLWAFGNAEKRLMDEDKDEDAAYGEDVDGPMGGEAFGQSRPGTRQSQSRGRGASMADPPQGKGAGGRSSIASVPSKLLRFLHRPLQWQDVAALGLRVRPPTGGDGDEDTSPAGGTGSVAGALELQTAPPLPAAAEPEATLGQYLYRRWIWLQFPQLALSNAQQVMDSILGEQGDVARARMGLQPPRSFAARRTTRRVHPPVVPMPAAAPWPPAESGPLLSIPREAHTVADAPPKRSGSAAGTRLATRGTARGTVVAGARTGRGAGHGFRGSSRSRRQQLSSPGGGPPSPAATPAFALKPAGQGFSSMVSVLDPDAERDRKARSKAMEATDEQLLGPEQPLYAAASQIKSTDPLPRVVVATSPHNRIDADAGNGSLVADQRRRELRDALLGDDSDEQRAGADDAGSVEQHALDDSDADSDGPPVGKSKGKARLEKMARSAGPAGKRKGKRTGRVKRSGGATTGSKRPQEVASRFGKKMTAAEAVGSRSRLQGQEGVLGVGGATSLFDGGSTTAKELIRAAATPAAKAEVAAALKRGVAVHSSDQPLTDYEVQLMSARSRVLVLRQQLDQLQAAVGSAKSHLRELRQKSSEFIGSEAPTAGAAALARYKLEQQERKQGDQDEVGRAGRARLSGGVGGSKSADPEDALPVPSLESLQLVRTSKQQSIEDAARQEGLQLDGRRGSGPAGGATSLSASGGGQAPSARRQHPMDMQALARKGRPDASLQTKLEIASGYEFMSSLEDRAEALAAALQSAQQQRAFLRLVMRACERSPPTDGGYAKRLQDTLQLVEKEAAKLRAEEESLRHEEGELRTSVLPKLLQTRDETQAGRERMLQRISMQRERQQKLMKDARERELRRLEIANAVAGDMGDDEERELREKAESERELVAAARAEVDKLEQAHQAELGAMQRLKDSTGVRDAATLLDRWRQREELVSSMQGQQSALEDRAATLRKENKDLRAQLSALGGQAGRAALNRDARSLEEEARREENKAQAVARQVSFVSKLLGDVRAGALHMCQLLRIGKERVEAAIEGREDVAPSSPELGGGFPGQSLASAGMELEGVEPPTPGDLSGVAGGFSLQSVGSLRDVVGNAAPGPEAEGDDLSAVTVPQDRIAAVLRLVEGEAIRRMHRLAQHCDPATARAADAMGLSKVAAYLQDRAALSGEDGDDIKESSVAARQPFSPGSQADDDEYGDEGFEDGDGEGKEADSAPQPTGRAGRKAEDRKLAAHMLGLEVAADGYVDGRQLSETPSRSESVRVRSDIARFQHELMEVVEAGGIGAARSAAALAPDGRRPKRAGSRQPATRHRGPGESAGPSHGEASGGVSAAEARQSVASSVVAAAHDQKVRRRLGLSEHASPDEVLARRTSRDPRALRDASVGGLVQRLLDAPLAADLASTTLDAPHGSTKKDKAAPKPKAGGKQSRRRQPRRGSAAGVAAATGIQEEEEGAGARPSTSASRLTQGTGDSRSGRRASATSAAGMPSRRDDGGDGSSGAPGRSPVPRVARRASPSRAGVPQPAVAMGLTQRELLEGLLRSHGVGGDALDRAATAAIHGRSRRRGRRSPSGAAGSGPSAGGPGATGFEAEAEAEASRAAAGVDWSLQDPEAVAEAAAAEVLAGRAAVPVAEARRLRRVLGTARFIAESGVSNTASVEGIDAILGAGDDVVSRQALKEVGWAAKQAMEARRKEKAALRGDD